MGPPAIEEGVALITAALPCGPTGPYQLQAAIAAVHDEAASAAATDWPQIAALYGVLLQLDDNPVVALNHAVAVSKVAGPGAGLELLRRLEPDGQGQLRPPFPCRPRSFARTRRQPRSRAGGLPGRGHSGHERSAAALSQPTDLPAAELHRGPGRSTVRYRRVSGQQQKSSGRGHRSFDPNC